MLVVSGLVKIHPERKKDAMAAALVAARATRQEAGCLAYEFSTTFEDENTVRLFEIWENQAALQRHFTTPHIAEFNKALAGVMAAPAEFTLYHVSEATPLGVSRR
jgi:quinol monooxygenase YgiN